MPPGFGSYKEILDVILVPLLVALIAILWPRSSAARAGVHSEPPTIGRPEELGHC
jgi:hypothetical protein